MPCVAFCPMCLAVIYYYAFPSFSVPVCALVVPFYLPALYFCVPASSWQAALPLFLLAGFPCHCQAGLPLPATFYFTFYLGLPFSLLFLPSHWHDMTNLHAIFGTCITQLPAGPVLPLPLLLPTCPDFSACAWRWRSVSGFSTYLTCPGFLLPNFHAPYGVVFDLILCCH